MSLRNFLGTTLFFCLSFFTVQTMMAGEPTDRVRAATDRLLSIITDPELEGPERAETRNKMIRDAVDDVFDWEAFSQRALATHWRDRSSEEREEFISLFGQLLERTYMDKTRQYSGERIIFLEEELDGEYGIIKAKVITGSGREIDVDYRVMKTNGEWFIYDVYVEGVSFVNNYRVQFHNIITRSSYEELIRRLKEKVSKE